jgi:hypothetical protein
VLVPADLGAPFAAPLPQLGWEVVVAVVENNWLVLPGNLPGFHAWLQPSEIKETSVINYMTLLPILEDTILKQIAYVFHSILLFQNIKIGNKIIKHKTYITT